MLTCASAVQNALTVFATSPRHPQGFSNLGDTDSLTLARIAFASFFEQGRAVYGFRRLSKGTSNELGKEKRQCVVFLSLSGHY